MDSSLYSSRHFRSRGRITPPAFLSKVTHKTTEFINHLRGRIESPTFKTNHTTTTTTTNTTLLLSRRRGDSSDGFSSGSNTNINNNIELNEMDTSSIKTTSTSSSTHSGFLGFTLPTTIDVDDPLPIPVCRLGKYQAEWNTGELGAWRLLTHDTIPTSQSAGYRSEPSLSVLKRMNKDLKEEQKFLLTKLNLLYDNLVKQTALVNQHERKLDKLRTQLKQKTENTPEDIRADLIHELNELIEKTRSRQHLDLMSITESMPSESTDSDENASKGQSPRTTNRLMNKNKAKKVSHDENSSTIRFDETGGLYSPQKIIKDEIDERNEGLSQQEEYEDVDRDVEELGDKTQRQNQQQQQHQMARVDVKSPTGKSFSQIPNEKSKSSVKKFTENEITSFDSSYTEMSASQSKGKQDTDTSESESTESAYHHKSSDNSDDDDDGDDDENVDVKSETLQESSSQEKEESKTEDNDDDDDDDDDDGDSEEDYSEEELTKTDGYESESCITESRQRVVQFGTVSRR